MPNGEFDKETFHYGGHLFRFCSLERCEMLEPQLNLQNEISYYKLRNYIHARSRQLCEKQYLFLAR